MWKTLRKTYLFGLLLLGCAFVSFLNSGNANATKVLTGGTYAYRINNGGGSVSTWSGTPPVELLTGAFGSNKYLFGYNVTGTVYNEFSGTYPTNIVRVTTRLGCTNTQNSSNGCTTTNPGNEAVTISGTTHNGNNITGSCTMVDTGTVKSIEYKCNLVADGYDYPETWSVTIGYTTVFVNTPIASICGGSQCMSSSPLGSVRIETATVEVDSSRDPNTGLLQEQINQNTTIINQNEEIINTQNEINDWLKDDTAPNVDSSGLAQSAGWLPAGPVDSILTIPITLLTGIVNVFTNPSACQAVQLPLPFVNTNIELPCVGPILEQIGITPLWNIVGAIIGFFLIWNTYKWLYEFVDKTLTFRENNSSIWGGL